MVRWLKSLWKWLEMRRLGVYWTIPLPSFYRNTDTNIDIPIEGAMQQSRPTDWSADDVKDVEVSRDWKHAHPELIKRLKEAIASYGRMFPNRQVITTCTYRSPAAQKKLWMQGRNGDTRAIVTMCDGYVKKSQHNYYPSRAVDIAICENGKAVWDEAVFFPFANLAKQCGLESGMFWEKFQDPPHVQIPKDVV